MSTSREHVKTIFGRAAEIEAADERSRFLDEACSGDQMLRSEVEGLLASMGQAGDFLVPCHFTDQTIDSQRPERPGTKIGPYKLLQQIGEGGMGVVYMAEQTQPVERRVALKIIKPGMDSRQVVARFEAERQALAMMDHPNIAKVLDAGTTESGRPYFVMELVKGVPITKYCDEKRLSLRERLELMIPVCQAIQHAHQKGIIHRDIKPTNVLIAQYDGKPVPKVIDFGVAKATAQKLTERTMFTELGQVVGTIEYMSPEQAELNQLDIDTRSDIYSLGVLLYELLTGSTPFDKQKLRTAAFHEMLRIIREDEPPKPSTNLSTTGALPSIAANRQTEPARLSKAVRGELDWIVMKALDKDRNRRYETANGFAADILRYLDDEPVAACPPSAAYRLAKLARRHKAALTTAALLTAALVLGTVVSSWQALRATQATSLANQRLMEVERERKQAEANATLAMNASSLASDRLVQVEQQRAEAQKKEREAIEAGARAKQSADDAQAILQFFQGNVFAAGRPKGSLGGIGPEATVRQALDRAEAKIGPAFKDRPLVEAQLRSVLGGTYRTLFETELAVTQLDRAIELFRANNWGDHDECLIAMTELALTFTAASNLLHDVRWGQKAVALNEELLQRATTQKGPTDPFTISMMNNLAMAYRVTGQTEKGIALQKEAYELAKATVPDETRTLTMLSNLGSCYMELKRYEDAIAIYEECVELLKAKFGPGKSRMELDTAISLANAYLQAGRSTESLSLYEQLVVEAKLKLGPTDPQTLSLMGAISFAYLRAGQAEKATTLFVDTVRLEKQKYGPDHRLTISTMDKFGTELFRQQRYAEADPVLREALAASQLAEPDAYPQFRFKSLLAGTLLGQAKKLVEMDPAAAQAKLAEAEPLLLDGYEGLKARVSVAPGIVLRTLPETIDRLIELYTLLDKPAEAAKWQAEQEAAAKLRAELDAKRFEQPPQTQAAEPPK